MEVDSRELFRHVSAEKSAMYRTIMDAFAAAKRQFQLHLRPNEVLAAFIQALRHRAELPTVALQDISSRRQTLLTLPGEPLPDAAKLHETLSDRVRVARGQGLTCIDDIIDALEHANCWKKGSPTPGEWLPDTRRALPHERHIDPKEARSRDLKPSRWKIRPTLQKQFAPKCRA
jgi:Protein of unknown function (DUF2397)